MSKFLPSDRVVESLTRHVGEQLFAAMDRHPAPTLLSKQGAKARLMEWVLEDPALKTQIFRFVDVLPSLESSAAIVEHLQDYLEDKAVELNPAFEAGLHAASLAPGLVAAPVKAQIADMAAQFVVGEALEALIARVRTNAARGLSTTIDLLGESVVSDHEADVFLQRNLAALDAVATAEGAADEGTVAGAVPRFSLSLKMSALAPGVDPTDPARAIAKLARRLRPILRRAAERDTHVTFDMEHHALKNLTLDVFMRVLEEEEFHETPAMGIAIQAYLRDSAKDLERLVSWSRRTGRHVSIRLVKGAYWDFEVARARQRGWPVPVWLHKAETDARFEQLTAWLLDRIDVVRPHFATHNVRSCAHAIARARQRDIAPDQYEFQALYGMADELKMALVETGCAVREYCPVGALLPGMAYFVRRLLENTSNEGFLHLTHAGGTTREELLVNPVDRVTTAAAEAPAAEGFRNAPTTDFTRADARQAQQEAIARAERRFGRVHGLVIDGREIRDRELVESTNPAHPDGVIGRWAKTTVEDADRAVEACVAYAPRWRDTPVDTRAGAIERAADLMEERRFDLNALIIAEAGKPWTEADADVSEAIDFCRFYAWEMRRLAVPVVTQSVAGEACTVGWTPRGVGVAIAPWNFPLAILTGLTVAPLVAGNCMIVKPAHQTAIIGATLVDILRKAGVSDGAVHYLPGSGSEVGACLVADPRVDFVAFTGSRSVGCGIWETAGRTVEGQLNLKKVVCEMGGKNALIIDTDADLDEAIPAVLASAFGYAGQKCSALSRLIVLEAGYDHFLDRFLAACATVPVGDPAEPGTVVGPVIDDGARETIQEYIEQGRREATVAFEAELSEAAVASGGSYVAPTVFVDCEPHHRIVREEIFGPVIAVLKARDLDHALALANDSAYALTGGVFSRSPRTIDRVKTEFRVGNLYVNRTITGAIVERHPFGGFRMSGGGTKAGGREYLKNFLFPRTVAENVMRRGFVPPAAPSESEETRP